jgi:hypothetical protein
MEYRFNADEWSALAPRERARRCRLMAGEARSLAEHAPSLRKRQLYSEIAADWLELATEIERHGS